MNGVVRVLKARNTELEKMGYQVTMITPNDFKTFTMSAYPEIDIAYAGKNGKSLYGEIAKKLKEAKPDFIHIATAAEGTLGRRASKYCRQHHIAFTAELHSRIPEYVAEYAARKATRFSKSPVTRFGYRMMRRYHNMANHTIVPSQSFADELKEHNMKNLMVCPHGVDSVLFHPGESHVFDDLPKPIFLYVGRVAVEKGIDKFLELSRPELNKGGRKLPGTLVVVGSGPERKELESRFGGPNVKFMGKKEGEELVKHYQGADVVVFPSKTDTFGNVNVEALACGKPVAGFPATGILDIINSPELGSLNEDLYTACMDTLALSRKQETALKCRQVAEENYKWSFAVDNFIKQLVWVGAPTMNRTFTVDNIWEKEQKWHKLRQSQSQPDLRAR